MPAGAALGGLAAIVLGTALGVGFGTLVGKQIPAVIAAMVWFFILEPLTNLVGHVSKFTVGQTATSMAETPVADVPLVGALLVMAGWTLLFVIAGALVDRRRDIA